MNKINSLGIMVDCSRDAVYNVATLKKYIKIISDLGYKTLQLYTEDTYTINDEYFGYMRGRYTEDELIQLDNYASENGIELIPCIQTLAHLSGFLRWKPEFADVNDILLVNDDKTYELIDKMFYTCSKCFKSRRINIGMDEAHFVGLGKYLANNGYQDRTNILLNHLNKVLTIARKYGFHPMMWSDMFFRLANEGEYMIGDDCKALPEKVLKVTPTDVDLVYWDYWTLDSSIYEKMMKAHKKFKNKIIFAGGATAWTGFIPKNESSIEATEMAVKSCFNNDIDEFVLTCWKDDGAECSLFASLPTIYATSQMAKGIFDKMLWKQGFKQYFGVNWEDFMLLDLPDKLDKEDKWTCPCKYMLYSDPFVGIFDYTVDLNKKQYYQKVSTFIKKAINNSGDFKYIFNTIFDVCEVMKYKYSLGVETRELYLKGDINGLKQLLNSYNKLESKTKKLRNSLETQWFCEAKNFGFEKQDVRLGGLLQRIKSCKQRLKNYVDGKEDKIIELEQKILPFREGQIKGKALVFNNWLETAFIKPLM